MDTIYNLLEKKTGTAVGSGLSIGVSFLEWLPFWLRMGILMGTLLTIWVRFIREFRN